MMWLIGRSHSAGMLPRRRLVSVAVACVDTVAHLLDGASLPHFATVSSWASGDDDVSAEDLRKAKAALWDGRRHTDAAAYTAYTAYAAYAAYAADAAMCDVFRDTISIDEVCASLGLDPDQGVQ